MAIVQGKSIYLGLLLHNHQPIGNFPWVFQQVYEEAYLPLIEALERHPRVRLSLHYTGSLLDWMYEAQPGFLRGWLLPLGQTAPATSTAGLVGTTPSSPNTSSTGPTTSPTASNPDVPPTASVSPSPSSTAYPGQQYMRSAQMANGVDSQTLQPQQPTNTFRVGSRMYAVFTLHPPIQGGTVCSSWYLNGSQFADVSLSMSGDSPGGYIYVIYHSPGMAYVELYWASDTTCADKALAQHLDFTVTAS